MVGAILLVYVSVGVTASSDNFIQILPISNVGCRVFSWSAAANPAALENSTGIQIAFFGRQL